MAHQPGAKPLHEMFESVPRRYDLINRLMTFQLDKGWRQQAAALCQKQHPTAVLDLCCGTGDLTFLLAQHSSSRITGLDFSPAMLSHARTKAATLEFGDRLDFVLADSTTMPFADDHFDAVAIAFAFRNLTWNTPLKDPALAEVLRVLKPGGRFVIVETSQPKNALMRIGFHTFLQTAMAPLAGLISGQRQAYRYLARSARNFYDAEQVSQLLSQSGFSQVTAKPLMGGVAALHMAIK